MKTPFPPQQRAAAKRHPLSLLTGGLFLVGLTVGASADALPSMASAPSIFADGAYHEIETKYIFGFTQGSDIGAEGEKAIELETTAAFQKRGGRFSSVEQEIEFEHVPTQFFAYELSAHGLMVSTHGVEGVDDRNRTGFSGLSAKGTYLILGRGPESPIGLSLSIQPEWARIDGTSGLGTRAYSTSFTLNADTEIIPNRLYAAANLSYAPQASKQEGDMFWDRTSTLGVTGALAFRITPRIALGGEVEYYSGYDGLFLQNYTGHAIYVGPTLHIQFTNKVMLAAAFSTQVAGHAVGDPRPLNLTDFEKYHFNLKFEVEF